MLYNVLIEDLDDFGRGLAHIDGKVVFVANALPEELVDIKINISKKNYSEGEVVKYLKYSPKRINPVCPYFNSCGGCHLLNMSYDETILFKTTKIKNLLLKNKIELANPLKIIKNPHPLNYRNKITLKIINEEIGFYKPKSHDLIKITSCNLAHPEINKVILNYQLLHLKNGALTIRVNSNNEILLDITSPDPQNIDVPKLKSIVKLVGIVYNDKLIFGTPFFYERINGYLFKVSYNSFFQVNPYICSKLFNLLATEIGESSNVLDLYSGVGTLSIVAASHALDVMSVEIIKNAVLNGITNTKLNKCSNIKFFLGDTSKIVSKLNFDFDTLIVDPPRMGLDKNTLNFILKKSPQKIIYISCDPLTLMRDLNVLKNSYKINSYTILDMFSFTYHVESMCVLNKR